MRYFLLVLLLGCSTVRQTVQDSTVNTSNTNSVLSVVTSPISFSLQTSRFKTFNATSSTRISKDLTVKRIGDFSYRIDLLAADASNDNSKKSELVGMIGTDGKEIFERDGNTSFYAFSFMVANDWVSPVGHAGGANHATVLQFKTADLPVIAFMAYGEQFLVRVNWAKSDYPIGAYYYICDLKRGKWQDFLIKIKFSRTSGNITVWDGNRSLLLTVNVPTATYDLMSLHTGLYTPQDSVNRRCWIGALTRSSTFEAIQNIFDTLAQSGTNWGVFILNSGSAFLRPQQIIDSARKLGVNTIRYNYTNGGRYNCQVYKDSGFKVVMTVNRLSNLDSLLKVSKPDLLTYINEPSNKNFYTGTAAQYVQDLTTFINIGHTNGVKISDGGSMQDILYSLYSYYLKNNTDSATWLHNLTGIASGTYSKQKAAWYDTILPAYRSSDLDFVNLHWYEPNPIGAVKDSTVSGLLPVAINYLTQQTGKPVITNETGTRTTSKQVLFDLLNTWKGKEWVIYFDGSGSYAVSNDSIFAEYIKTN